MIKILLFVMALCAATIAWLWAALKSAQRKTHKLEEKNAELRESAAKYKARTVFLEAELKAKTKNEEEANAKITALHSGDVFDNALHILQER